MRSWWSGLVLLGMVLAGCDNAKLRLDDIHSMTASVAKNAVFTENEVATGPDDLDGDGIDDFGFTVPYSTDLGSLVVEYTGDCDHVFVGDVEQESGVTANDFTVPLIYSCANSEGARHEYRVRFGFDPPSSDKRILTFGFADALNDELDADAIGVVNGGAIAVTVPFGTEVSSLVPTFTFVGEQVTVGGVPQTSGVTAQSYTVPVGYAVRAQDGSTFEQTVTVTVAGSPDKDITLMTFTDAANSALTVDIPTTINGTAISGTLPFGTDRTALVPTFSTTATSVSVNGTAQVSGVTAQDFTSPVTYVAHAADASTKAYMVTLTDAPSNAKDLTAFSFRMTNNAQLPADVIGTINGTAIALTVPFGTNVGALVASFVTTGASVAIGGTTQTSGTTPNNFAAPLVYRVTAADASTKDYTVTVTVAANPAKDLTAFQFLDTTNAALTADVTATITGTSIAATVPFGTDVSALVASFATSGASVSVGGIVQASGITPNNFSSMVSYVVTAADTTTKTYTVTVTIAPNPAKEITAFAFPSAPNGLPADVTATITGTAIAATVPFGTNVGALVATYTTTGASVRVNGAVQASGITPNNFASPVVYEVTAADGTTKTFTVTVTIAPGTSKDFVSFNFLDPANTALAQDVIGTIAGTAITLTVPPGTDVTALVATFAHTGTAVAIGGTAQTSGLTANDFTTPVTYTVTAGDSSQKTYTVTVKFASRVVFPHIRVSANGAATTVTSTITGIYARMTSPQSARVEVRVYEPNGTIATGATGDVCNPCAFTIDGTTHGFVLDLATRAAAVGRTTAMDGFATSTISGDAAAVVMAGTTQTTPSGASVPFVDLLGKAGPALPPASGQRWTAGPLVENSSTSATVSGGLDTRLTYVLAPGAAGNGVVRLTLFDPFTGFALSGPGGAVCAPCEVILTPSVPRAEVMLQALLAAKGITSGVTHTVGIIDVFGAGATSVALIGETERGTTTTPSVVQRSSASVDLARDQGFSLLFVNPDVQVGSPVGTEDTIDNTTFYNLTSSPQPSANVANHVRNDDGTLKNGNNGQPICNGCGGSLGAGFLNERSTIISVAQDQGGIASPQTGLWTTSVIGPAALATRQTKTVTSTSTGTATRIDVPPQPATSTGLRTFVLPHILEKSGTIQNTTFTFDTTIFATYVGGLTSGSNSGASVDLYLFDDSGGAMQNNGTNVCAPCTFALGGASARKRVIEVDDLVEAKGAFTGVKNGYGVVVVGGTDRQNVAIQGFVVSSHATTTDLSVFGFAPSEIASN